MCYFILSYLDFWEYVSDNAVFCDYISRLPENSVFYKCDLGTFWYMNNKLVAFCVKSVII